jgi:hypothetical protein
VSDSNVIKLAQPGAFSDSRRRPRLAFEFDFQHQPALHRLGSPFLLDIFGSRATPFKDESAQLGDASAVAIVEIYQPHLTPRQRFHAFAIIRALRMLTSRDPVPHNFRARPKLGFEGDPSDSAMPGRVCARHGELGVTEWRLSSPGRRYGRSAPSSGNAVCAKPVTLRANSRHRCRHDYLRPEATVDSRGGSNGFARQHRCR